MIDPALGKTPTAALLDQLFREQLAFEKSSESVDRVDHADLIIVGSGIAGLSAAITAARHLDAGQRVVLITKTELGDGGSSRWAQGGIAAAVGGVDDQVEHAEDTLRVGRELCEPEIVEHLTSLGDEAVARLVSLGVRFDVDADGAFLLGREGGHHRRRVLHAEGDATGKEIMRALRVTFTEMVKDHPRVVLEENFFAQDLLIVDDETFGGRHCAGVFGSRTANGERAETVAWLAPRVVLATGGMGQLFQYTTNPQEVTGDGIAMAARAGALLADMEMIQFHPTTLAVGSELNQTGKAMLLTEALRGEGALLLDEQGRRFMKAVHELAELAPRDVVARTLWQRSARGERSFLDLRPVQDALVESGSHLARRFPTAYKQCKSVGLDPLSEPVPITPAAHYTMGGVWTDSQGHTSLEGLLAIGEVASSGVHGANRLASNSLLEGAVFGHEFTLRVLHEMSSVRLISVEDREAVGFNSRWQLGDRPVAAALETHTPGLADHSLRDKIRRRMWQGAGLVRDADALRELDRELMILQRFRPNSGPEERNLLLLGRLLCNAALARTESRGGHYRSDFPASDPKQARRNIASASRLLGEDTVTPLQVEMPAVSGLR